MTPRVVLLAVVLLVSACGSSDPADQADAAIDSTPDSSQSDLSATTDSESTTLESSDQSSDTSPTTATGEPTTTTEVEAVEYPPAAEVDCSTMGRVPVGLQTGSIMSGGIEYKYQWTVPSTYAGTPIAVVLDFHGIGSNGAQEAVFSGWAALAEAEGFLAVEPTGTNIAPDDRASWELPQFESNERDDIAMVVDLLDHVASNVCIDPARVYATGMSNGALFTSSLVCNLGNRIAAAVSVAGVTHDDSCTPTRPMPYLAFHGTDDTTIPFRGGGESTLGGGASGGFFEQVMPDEFAEFANDFGCSESVDSPVSEQVTLTSYSGCDADVEMGFYTIDGGGHTWPGSVISSAIPSLGVTNMDVDATAIAWEFFQRYTL